MRVIDNEAMPPKNQAAEELQPGNETSLLDLLIVLGKGKWLLVKATLAAAMLALIVTLLIPNRYTATTTILPPQQNSSMSSVLLNQISSLGSLGSVAGSLGLKNPAELYVALLKSRTVEDSVIARFELMNRYGESRLSDARKELEKRISVESDAKGGLIRISVEDRDAVLSAQIANAYVDEYKKFSANLNLTEASQRRAFFEKQLEDSRVSLATAEENLKRTEQTTGMIQLDSQAKALIQSVASLKAQIASKEVQIRAMSSYATENNPDVLLAKEQLAGLQGQLRQMSGSGASEAEVIIPRGKITDAGLVYIRNLRDVKYFETIFELLAKQYEIAKLDEAKQGATIQVVDFAVPPDRKSFPKRLLIVVLSSIAGFLAAALWVLFREVVAVSKQSPETGLRWHLLRTNWSK